MTWEQYAMIGFAVLSLGGGILFMSLHALQQINRKDGQEQTLAYNQFLYDRLEVLERENERMEKALQHIKQWGEAYPLDIFPMPDLARADTVLKANGMSLGAISAHNMRHCVRGIYGIACKGLNLAPDAEVDASSDAS